MTKLSAQVEDKASTSGATRHRASRAGGRMLRDTLQPPAKLMYCFLLATIGHCLQNCLP